MLRGVTDLVSVLGQLVPTPVLVGILVLAALLALPAWLRSVRVRQIKGALRRAARAHGEAERQHRVDEAFDRAGGRPRLLVALAEQAIRNGQTHVWRRALDELEATGRLEIDLLRLRRKVAPTPRPVRDPIEAVVRIERQLDLGLVVAAREALDEALEAHPDDPDMLALAARVREAEAARAPDAASQPLP